MQMSPEIKSFVDFSLPPHIQENLQKAKYVTPSPIQAQAIPAGLVGRDVIGIAQTGTGKTAAFALPMLVRLAGMQGTGGLILAPTRELAMQIAEVFARLGARIPVSFATIIGGANMNQQVQALRRKPTIIIATPGRLIDHLQQRTVDLHSVRMLVLDEADRMLDMGFLPQIRRIFVTLPKQRQTMVFSATMPPQIARLISGELKNPVRIEVARAGATADRVSQSIYMTTEAQKAQLLLWLLQKEAGTVLVFTRTKHRADKIAAALERAGQTVERIHGNRSLSQRIRALAGFKSGQHRVLIATDIAARGIDVANIAHVVNYDLPQAPEDYVHRIGRTARAAASGNAISFVTGEDRNILRAIERLIKHTLPVLTISGTIPEIPLPKAAPLRDAFSARRGRPMPHRGGGGRVGAFSARHGQRYAKPQPVVAQKNSGPVLLPGEGAFWETRPSRGGGGGHGGKKSGHHSSQKQRR